MPTSLQKKCIDEFRSDEIDISKFTSLELSFLVGMGALEVVPKRLHKLNSILKSGNQPKYLPQSMLLGRVLHTEWLEVSKPLFEEILKIFKGEKLDLDAWRRGEALMPSVGKDLADGVRDRVGHILDVTIANSKIHFQRMADKLKKKKDDAAWLTWSQWEKWLRLGTADLFEEFYSTYPQRILAPQIVTIIDRLQSAIDVFTPKDLVDAHERMSMFAQGDENYWNVLSSTEVSYLWNAEAVHRADLNGISTYQIVSMNDDLVCPVCELLNGMTVDVQVAKEQVMEIGSLSAEQLKEKYPFPRIDQIERLTVAELEAVPGAKLPPYHGRCRCTLVYVGGP